MHRETTSYVPSSNYAMCGVYLNLHTWTDAERENAVLAFFAWMEWLDKTYLG